MSAFGNKVADVGDMITPEIHVPGSCLLDEDPRPEPAGIKANILVLADLFLPHSGGSRVYYYHLYKHWSETSEDRITVLTRKVPGYGQFDVQVATPSFRIVRRFAPLLDWKLRQWPKCLLSFFEAAYYIQKLKIDQVHCGDLFPQGIAAWWLKRVLGIPFLIFCHGEEVTQTDERRFQPLIRDRIYQAADRVVAANDYARQHLVRIGVNPNKISTIYPGVDRTLLYPKERNAYLAERLNINGKFVLLTVSRLVPRKGHSMVMRALAQLATSLNNLHYVIVGRGPEDSKLRQLAGELGITNAVTFAGSVPSEELNDFYNLCDVFVMPNRTIAGDNEGFGMVFLEANAVAKPVIAGRSGGADRAVIDGKTGLLVDSENVEEIAAAIRRLASDRLLRSAMGEAGLSRVCSDFEWQDKATALQTLSIELLASRHSTGPWNQEKTPEGSQK